MNENDINIKDFISQFGITPLETAKDEGLLSVDNCRKRLMELVQLNIDNFRNNSWSTQNQMQKLLIELGKNKTGSIFSLRLAGKRVYRCSCIVPTDEDKINFLTTIYRLLENRGLDEVIIKFCEKEVKLAEIRKDKQRAKQREKRKAKKLAEKLAKEQEKKMALAKLQTPNNAADTLPATETVPSKGPTA